MGDERERADRLLVKRGYFDSRTAAVAAIMAGGVTADGERVHKPSQTLSLTAEIAAEPAHPYVSRGGLKLAHALDAFRIRPEGQTCLDIGASTGGFTDVLLQRGAAHVTAIDVGHDQLHKRLRDDPRVVSRERTDARNLTQTDVKSETGVIVSDVSFISLTKALEVPMRLVPVETDLVALFKPQFEVGRAHIGRGGIVTDMEAVQAAMETVEAWIAVQGWELLSWTDSPIKGGDGNAEHIFHARKR